MALPPDPASSPPPSATPPTQPATLVALFLGFLSIGMMSFGGGLAAWIRREVVQRRGWMDDPQFLTGYALSQLVPGATNVNLAVFIGAQLRGVPGALATLAGLMLLPVALILLAGGMYLRVQGAPGYGWVAPMLAGMGAVAIGLNLATGVRLARRNLRGIAAGMVTLATTVGIAVLQISLLKVLLVMLPVSLGLSLWRGRA
ncbi:MAG TPA: chromate transporter [Acetobacteraceae bacterium]|nr:chromate transporter [Acetobacteraceae bacterium]